MTKKNEYDGDIEADLWLDRQQQFNDESPAEWWERWVDWTGNTDAHKAFQRLVRVGCDQGELLVALRGLHYQSQAIPFSHAKLVSHRKLQARLQDSLAQLRRTELVYYRQLGDTAAALARELDRHEEELQGAANELRREPNGVRKMLIAEIERIVRRDTKQPLDTFVAVLLTSVSLPLRSPDALRVARGRERRKSAHRTRR